MAPEIRESLEFETMLPSESYRKLWLGAIHRAPLVAVSNWSRLS
jgi:hypothetical protein